MHTWSRVRICKRLLHRYQSSAWTMITSAAQLRRKADKGFCCCAISAFWRPAAAPFARTPPTKRRRWQSHGDPDCIDERNGEARTVPRPVRKRRRGCWPKLFAGTFQPRAPPGAARKRFAQARAWPLAGFSQCPGFGSPLTCVHHPGA